MSPIPRKVLGDIGDDQPPAKKDAKAGAKKDAAAGGAALRELGGLLRHDTRESENLRLRLQLAHEVQLRTQAETRLEDFRVAAEPLNGAAQLELEIKNRKLQVLQRRIRELEEERKLTRLGQQQVRPDGRPLRPLCPPHGSDHEGHEKATLQKTADHALVLAAQLQTALESHRVMAEKLQESSGDHDAGIAATRGLESKDEAAALRAELAASRERQKMLEEEARTAAEALRKGAEALREQALEHCAGDLAVAALAQCAEDEVVGLQERCRTLADRAEQGEARVQAERTEAERLRHQCEELERRIQALDTSIQSIQDLDTSSASLPRSSLGSRGSPSKAEASCRAELERATSQLETALQLSSEQQQELERTAAELEDARKNGAEQEQTLERAKAELEEAQRHAAEHEQELQRLAAELEQAREVAPTQEEEEAQRHAAEREEKLQRVAKELEEARKVVTEQERALADAAGRLEEAARRAAEQEQTATAQSSESERTTAELQEVRRELAEQERVVAEQEKRLVDQAQQIEDQAAEIGTKIIEVEELEAKLEESAAAAAEVQLVREKLAEAERVEGLLNEAGRELDEKDTALLDQSNLLEEQASELQEKADKLERSEVELDGIRREHADKERNNGLLSRIIKDQAEQIERQAQQLLEKGAEAEKAEAERDQVRSELQSKALALKDQAAQLEEHVAAAARIGAELGDARRELGEREQEAAQQAAKVQALTRQLAESGDAKECDVTDQASLLRDARAEARRLSEAHGAAAASVACLRRESQELGSRAARLEAERAREREEHARQRAEEYSAQTKAAAENEELAKTLAATVARLDEEQAERVRQGARAEALEEQLHAERARRGAQSAQDRADFVERRWVLLARTAALPREPCLSIAAGRELARAQRRRSLMSGSRRAGEVDLRLAAWALRLLEVSRQGAARQEAEAVLAAQSAALAEEVASLREEAAAAAKAREEANTAYDSAMEEVATLLEAKADDVELARKSAEERVVTLAAEAEEWQQKAEQAQQEMATLGRRMQDLSAFDRECEEMRDRSRELALTIQHFKEENELLVAENKSLRDSIGMFEGDLDRVTGRHAELIGHANKNQKIRYTMKLREECAQLRGELTKARSRVAQLEGSRRSEAIHEVITQTASVGNASVDRRRSALGEPPATPLRSPPSDRWTSTRSISASNSAAALPPAHTPARVASGSRVTPRRPQTARCRDVATEAHLMNRLEEAERRNRASDRALERTQADLQHVVSLVERVVLGDVLPKDDAPSASFSELLPRLRSMAMGERFSAHCSTGSAAFSSPSKAPRRSPGPSPDTTGRSLERSLEGPSAELVAAVPTLLLPEMPARSPAKSDAPDVSPLHLTDPEEVRAAPSSPDTPMASGSPVAVAG